MDTVYFTGAGFYFWYPKKENKERIGFLRFCVDEYGINWETIE